MELFLMIAGGIFVGFLLVIITIVLTIRYFLKKLAKQFQDIVEDATLGITPFMLPLRINLEQQKEPEWEDRSAVNRVTKPLRAEGFQDAGVYIVEELEDVQIQALAQTENDVYAVVYEHPDKGVWFEFVSRYENGDVVTFTTAEETGLDQPPHKTVEHFPTDTGAAAVYKQHLMRRPDEPRLPATPKTFREDFEHSYANDMDWRFERGGFTKDEIRRNLKRLGSDTSEKQIKQVHAMQQAQVNQWLVTKLAENYRAKAKIPPGKWRKIENRLLFVHDRLTSEEVHGMFTTWLDWDDDNAQEAADQAERIAEEGPARKAFAQMVELLPAERAPKKVAHLTEPVAADVYLGADVDDID